MPEDPDLPAENAAHEILPPDSWPAEAAPPEGEQVTLPPGEAWLTQPGVEAPLSEPPPLFQSWSLPEPLPTERIPHLGHLCMLGMLAMLGLLGAGVLMGIAFHFHLYGVSTAQQAAGDIHYTLGSMAALYLFTLLASLLVFPLFWRKSLFAGLQWNFATALRLRVRLLVAAGGCFVLAMIDELVLPGPTNAPIDKFFHTSVEAWLLFAFGVTFAPFFEETLFRGFLLPGLATAWDWTTEKVTRTSPRPLGENGHPQWSLRPGACRADRPCHRAFSAAGLRQPGALLGPAQHPLPGRQRPGPLQLQLPALRPHAFRNRRVPAYGQDVKTRE